MFPFSLMGLRIVIWLNVFNFSRGMHFATALLCLFLFLGWAHAHLHDLTISHYIFFQLSAHLFHRLIDGVLGMRMRLVCVDQIADETETEEILLLMPCGTAKQSMGGKNKKE
ncbi:hypothetical protein Dimus_014536 [Dionaea muscipula]